MQKAIRKRIAADLHDNIGAYATAISADVEKITGKGGIGNELQLQNLLQHSREIPNSLRDTIWVLNKDTITITGISDRIKNYINKLDPSYEYLHKHMAHIYQKLDVNSKAQVMRIAYDNKLNLG